MRITCSLLRVISGAKRTLRVDNFGDLSDVRLIKIDFFWISLFVVIVAIDSTVGWYELRLTTFFFFILCWIMSFFFFFFKNFHQQSIHPIEDRFASMNVGKTNPAKIECLFCFWISFSILKVLTKQDRHGVRLVYSIYEVMFIYTDKKNRKRKVWKKND